jgi:3-hydroxyisobutyrate dehydrogenase-like beta-hydroxyacid dehydrogenase
MQVAFLGLGQMGRAMAARLVATGATVRTWSRSGGVVDGAEPAYMPVVHGRCGMIVQNEFEPADCYLPLGLKDVRHVARSGREPACPAPCGCRAARPVHRGPGTGREDQDWSGIAGVVRENAGL